MRFELTMNNTFSELINLLMLIYEYTAVCIFHKTLLIYVKKKKKKY